MMPIINKTSLRHLRKHDEVMAMILKTYGAPPNWSRKEGYETLVKIILEQQVSLSSADASFRKLKTLVKKITPKNLANETIESLRTATVSRQKSSYIIGLANDILGKKISLRGISKLGREEQIKLLTSIRGIGPWTAEVYLLFAIQDQDIYPRGDIALINTIKELYEVGSAKEAEALSVHWKPYRSTASYLLWHYYLRKRGRTNIIES